MVLTAGHVISRGDAPPLVELQRYNLGLEHFSRIAGGWPRSYHAKVVAIDKAADLAVLRIATAKRLPFIARLDMGPEAGEPPVGTIVNSVGIDLGARLIGEPAAVAGLHWFALEGQDQERPFLVTTRPPEHGRSGGGLYDPRGNLVGVCIGRIEKEKDQGKEKGPRPGVYAAGASVRNLLREFELEPTIKRSAALGRRLKLQETASRPGAGARRSPP